MSGQQFHPGDLVHISAIAHVHSAALDTLVLRLAGGTLVRLRKHEPGVSIEPAGAPAPGDGGTSRGGLVPPARPTTTASPVDGGPGTTPSWRQPRPQYWRPSEPAHDELGVPRVSTGAADYARIGRRS